MREIAVHCLLVASLCGTWELNTRLEQACAVEPDFRGRMAFSGQLGSQRLHNVLVFTGLGVAEAAAVTAAAENRLEPGGPALEDRYSVVYSTAGRFRHLTITTAGGRVVVTPAPGGGFKASVRRAPAAEAPALAQDDSLRS